MMTLSITIALSLFLGLQLQQCNVVLYLFELGQTSNLLSLSIHHTYPSVLSILIG